MKEIAGSCDTSVHFSCTTWRQIPDSPLLELQFSERLPLIGLLVLQTDEYGHSSTNPLLKVLTRVTPQLLQFLTQTCGQQFTQWACDAVTALR